MRAPAGVRLESVTKHYTTPAGVVRAIDGITLELQPGASLAITGPSGSGKSTLLGLIGSLEVPTAGRVIVGGEEISGFDEAARARLRRHDIGFVFQSDNLAPFLTAAENVAQQLALSGAAGGYRRCLEVLAELGLADSAERLPDQLSRGGRQRVAVARALIHEPGLILADEPTGSLDAGNSEGIVKLLRQAQRDAGSTLVVVTHDPSVAERLERTLCLRDGRLAEDA